jgi:hypothetical protein
VEERLERIDPDAPASGLGKIATAENAELRKEANGLE